MVLVPATSADGKIAEREGFEPPVGYPTTVFKTAAFDHSAISLCASAYPKRGAKVERKVILAIVEGNNLKCFFLQKALSAVKHLFFNSFRKNFFYKNFKFIIL